MQNVYVVEDQICSAKFSKDFGPCPLTLFTLFTIQSRLEFFLVLFIKTREKCLYFIYFCHF